VPAVATTQKRRVAGRQISVDRSLKFLDIELQGLVDGDAAQSLATEAKQACRFVQRMMPFHRRIKNRLSRTRGKHRFQTTPGKRRESARARALKLASLPPVVNVPLNSLDHPTNSPIQPTVSAFDSRSKLRSRNSGKLGIQRRYERFQQGTPCTLGVGFIIPR